ncbi:MAG: hypothetical protein PWR32_111 [Candidatus Woesearchaeota archaeon]|nr:hypothetical protein [Candidatus Woesearchaeota archaeon]
MSAKKTSKKINSSKKAAKKSTTKKTAKAKPKTKKAVETKVTKPKVSKKAKTKSTKKPVRKVEIKKEVYKPKKLVINYMNLLQFILEFIVAAGFFLGLFGYNYEVLGYYCVLPLTFVNFVISLVENNRTITYSAINMVMALIAFYPIVGFFAKIVGIGLSISSITVLSARLHE